LLKPFTDWLDNRLGYRQLIRHALDEPIPGGARWRYVFGSALTAAFLVQVLTGLLLMASYSPSSSTAWGSVFYISHEMSAGWFIRGLHHFGSQAMIILLALHLLQVLIAGAYRAPREWNWWIGLILLFITLGLSLTGYLLPWDQKGYWATKVATNIMGSVPVLGPAIQRIVVGGSDYGNQTLTRFYALHVGLLPALLVLTLVVHIALFRRHGVTHPKNTRGIVDSFWPKQVFLDSVAALVVLGIMVAIVLIEHGAPLDAPANPSSADYPARPEWYFMSLFRLLSKPEFSGKNELMGTIVVPGAILLVLLALPLLDRVLPKGFAHFLACGLVFVVLGGAAYLTWEAAAADAANPAFQASRLKAETEARRAVQLAASPEVGIPPQGPAALLRLDPLTTGAAILESKCLSCHAFGGLTQKSGGQLAPQTASDLKGFGSREWFRALLEKPADDRFFGKVPACGGMALWKKGSKLTSEELDLIADFFEQHVTSAPEDLPPSEWAEREDVNAHPGFLLYGTECTKCHESWTEASAEAPNLYGWGSDWWTRRLIERPGAPHFYGYLEENDQMPAFGGRIARPDIETLIRYLKGDFLPPPATPAAPH
jgi:ubiquinol-cytochrome c reductase cytochrome b subunit